MRDVVRSDLGAYIAVFFLVVFWLIVFMLTVSFQLWPVDPQVSFAPVFIAVVGVTLLIILLLILRNYHTNLVLKKGKRVNATVDRFFSYSVYAQVWLSYRSGGETVELHLWLPSTALTRKLADLEEVQLFLPPATNLIPAIGTLYAPPA